MTWADSGAVVERLARGYARQTPKGSSTEGSGMGIHMTPPVRAETGKVVNMEKGRLTTVLLNWEGRRGRSWFPIARISEDGLALYVEHLAK